MKELEKFGIRMGEDLQHSHSARLEDFPFAEHTERADTFLNEIASTVLTNVREIVSSIKGKWNPGGFMVFPLGLTEDACSVRFHVWPQGMDRKTDQGPNPHNHSLHLSSRIMIGQYSDYILDVKSLKNESGSEADALKENDVYGLYSTHRTPGGKDILKTDGSLVRAIPRVSRNLRQGETHHIEAGEYHLSAVPQEILAATLVLDTPSFRESSDLLLKSIEPEILRVRRSLEEAQIHMAMDQVVAHLK
jgi:hypothetical protein